MFKILWDRTLHFRNECYCVIVKIFGFKELSVVGTSSVSKDIRKYCYK
jgi:hypothetical protein